MCPFPQILYPKQCSKGGDEEKKDGSWNTSPKALSLAACKEADRVQDSALNFKALHGEAPSYIKKKWFIHIFLPELFVQQTFREKGWQENMETMPSLLQHQNYGMLYLYHSDSGKTDIVLKRL